MRPDSPPDGAGPGSFFDAKESLGEYGSGWEWDSTWPKVFDYEKKDISIPEKYINSVGTNKPVINGTWVDYGGATSSSFAELCNTEITSGQSLASNTMMTLQVSCTPHSYNAGNYYNFPATSAGTVEPAVSSICPRGWMLPQNARGTSYAQLLLAYDIDYNATSRTNQDAALLNLPLSFLRSGYYRETGALNDRGYGGGYRMSSLSLRFYSDYLNPTDFTYATFGFSVRCVSR